MTTPTIALLYIELRKYTTSELIPLQSQDTYEADTNSGRKMEFSFGISPCI